MIIAFCGKAGAGKSQTADYLCEKHLIHPVAFADTLRMMVAPLAFLAANSDQDTANHYLYAGKDKPMPLVNISARQLYRDIGDSMRSHNPDVFVRLTELKINLIRSFYQRKMRDDELVVPIVIDDLRMQNEAEWIKSQGGIIIKITRPADQLRKLPEHHTEAGIPDSFIDFQFANDGNLYDLQTKAHAIGELYGLETGSPIAQEIPNTMRVH